MAMHNTPHPGGIVKRQCLEPLGLTVRPPGVWASPGRRFRSW